MQSASRRTKSKAGAQEGCGLFWLVGTTCRSSEAAQATPTSDVGAGRGPTIQIVNQKIKPCHHPQERRVSMDIYEARLSGKMLARRKAAGNLLAQARIREFLRCLFSGLNK